jgi:hypothetical protein
MDTYLLKSIGDIRSSLTEALSMADKYVPILQEKQTVGIALNLHPKKVM